MARSPMMRGAIHTVTQVQEKRLKTGGWLPVLRWSRMNHNGTTTVATTIAALRSLELKKTRESR